MNIALNEIKGKDANAFSPEIKEKVCAAQRAYTEPPAPLRKLLGLLGGKDVGLAVLALLVIMSALPLFGPRTLPAGHWTTIAAREGKTLHFRPEYGIPFDYMVDDNPTVHHSGPNGELEHIVFRKSIDVRPARDDKARVYYTDDR